MNMTHPLWLWLLVIWALVPVLDRLARPKASASLPLPQLAQRGLKPLRESLPWLSMHGLAFVLVVFALAGPTLPQRSGWIQEPALYVVTVADQEGATAARARFQELNQRFPQRPLGIIAAKPTGPDLLSPLTSSAAAREGLWPTTVPGTISPVHISRALTLASAKAPPGAWLVVIGGQWSPDWHPAMAMAQSRGQAIALLESRPALGEPDLAYRAAIRDDDAIAGLRWRLEEVSTDRPLLGPPHDLAPYCLAGALVAASLGWLWRQRRWLVTAP